MYRLRENGAAFVGPAQVVVNNEEINTAKTVATMISDLTELECKIRNSRFTGCLRTIKCCKSPINVYTPHQIYSPRSGVPRSAVSLLISKIAPILISQDEFSLQQAFRFLSDAG